MLVEIRSLIHFEVLMTATRLFPGCTSGWERGRARKNAEKLKRSLGS